MRPKHLLSFLPLFALACADLTNTEPTYMAESSQVERSADSAAMTKRMSEPVTISVGDAEVEEAEGATLDFKVTLSHAATQVIDVFYATYDSTATAALDYLAIKFAHIAFAPGDTTKVIPVVVLDDSRAEESETVGFKLEGVFGVAASQVTDRYAVGTILDSDSIAGGRVDIKPDSLTFNALGDTALVTVRVLDEDGNEDEDATWIASVAVFRHDVPYAYNASKGISLERVDGGLAVTAEGPGDGFIEFGSDGAESAILPVSVVVRPATAYISPDSIGLTVSETFKVHATLTDANGDSLRLHDGSRGGFVVYWESSDTAVATVTGVTSRRDHNTGATATVTAKSPGSAAITVSWGDRITGTAKVTVVGSPDLSPDLEVGASVGDSRPETGGSITLSANVTNSGNWTSASTTLRYYRSSDATITHSDTQVGTDALGALAAGGTSDQSIDLTAPSSAGTYYYGACVDAVAGESDASNNCSASVRVEVFVPLTATLANLPETHDAQTAFTFDLSFIVEPYGLSYVTVRDGLFDVTNAKITGARRATPGSNLAFVVTVQPSAASDITLTVRGTADCAAQHAVCTEDGRMLAGGTSDTVAIGLPAVTMSVADTEVEEADGATLDFTVTLSRAAAQKVEVSYRAYDGTAQAGADYEAVDSNFTLAPGETTKTISVVVLDDAEKEDSETVKFWLWGVRGMSASQITDPHAVGTIRDSRSNPDLEVGASVDDSSPEEGGSFALSATVTNSGDAASASTTLRYYRSSDATISSSDAEVDTDAVGALAAGGTSDQSVDLTAPSAAGTYYYGACVDAVTGESDTSNNCSASIQVEVEEPPPPTSPDLEVDASVDDSNPETGGLITLSATVTNSGNGASASTTLRYYRSSDATITSSDAQVGTDAVGALAAAGTSDQSVGLTAPSSAGTYYYGACVDAVTGESSKTNNCSERVQVDVSAPLTAEFADLPSTHDGATPFTFELRFSEAPTISYVTVRDALFDVTNGRITHARRVTKGSNLAFVVTVKPSAASDISLSVRGTTDCEAQHAVCTTDGHMLVGGTSATVAMASQ